MVIYMVYCTKCGTKNEENADICVKCKQPLGGYHGMRHERRKKEDECFGLPNGGSIFGIIIGLMIILWGASSVLDIDFGRYLWPLMIVIFGILIVVGSLYSINRRR